MKIKDIFGNTLVLKKRSLVVAPSPNGSTMAKKIPVKAGEKSENPFLTRLMNLTNNQRSISAKDDFKFYTGIFQKYNIENSVLQKAESYLLENRNFSVLDAVSMVLYKKPMVLTFKLGADEL